jgi:osmotically-inducible protein OsmY
LVERAGDEVRSWFGDDDAERRRRMDDPGRDRDSYRERQWGQSSEYGRGQEFRGQDNRGQDYRGQDDRSQEFRGQRYGGDDYGRSRASGGSGFRGVSEYASRSGSEYDTGRSGSSYGAGANYGYSSGASYGGGYSSYGPGSSQAFQGYGQGTGGRASYNSEFEGSAGRGSFAGRGPKGYRRSDSRISEDVCDRLAESPDVDASNIEVKVENGEVTLTGSVAERGEKRRAEDLIENISGVLEVHNHLRVNRGQGGHDDGLGRTSVLGLDAGANAGATGGHERPTNSTVGAEGSGAGTGSAAGASSSAAFSTGDSANPGITGGGPSGATDISNTSASSPVGSTLGLNDRTEKTSTAGGRR